MRKKRIRKIITRILELIVLSLGIGLLLLQTPFVQTKLAHKVTQVAEKHLDADLHFSAIKFAPFNTLIIKDLAIIDRHPVGDIDTVMAAKHISATFSLKGLLAKKGGVHIDRLRTKDFDLYLVIYDTTARGYTNNIASIFNAKHHDRDTLQTFPDLFSIKRADVDNFHYKMVILTDSDYNYKGHGINWKDLEVWADTRGHDINFVDSRCRFDVDWVRAREKCGYSFWGAGHCITGLGLTEVTDTRIIDSWSNIYLKRYTMGYEKDSDWGDFLYKIRLGADASAAPLSLKTVSIFSGIFKDSPILMDVEALKLDGPVNSMNITQASFTDRYSGVKADLSLDYKDLLSLQHTEVDLVSKEFRFTPGGVSKFVSAFLKDTELDFSACPESVKADLKGEINGPLNDMQANLNLTSNIGDINISAKAKDLIKQDSALSYEGEINLDKVDLAKAGLGKLFGRTSLSLQSSGKLGGKDRLMDVQLNKLDINEFTINNYTYGNIDGNGYFRDNTFTGNLRCNDPSLNFILGGSFSLSSQSKNSIYKFNLALGYADLMAMNIDKRPGTSTLSTAMNFSFRNTDKHALIGDATVSKLTYTDQKGTHNIGDILFASVTDHEKIRINLRSAFADLTYSGDPDLSTLLNHILNNTIGQYLPSLMPEEKPTEKGRNFESQIIIKDTKEVLSFLRKDILIAHGTQAQLSMAPSGELNGTFSSNGVRYENNIFRGLEARIQSQDSTILVNAGINEIKTGTTGLKKARLNIKAESDKTCMQISAIDILNKNISLFLDMDSVFSREENHDLKIYSTLGNSFINLDGSLWTCSHPNITYKEGFLNIDNFRIFHDGQSLELHGSASRHYPSELALNIRDIDLSVANLFLDSEIALAGLLNGFVNLRTPLKTNMGLQAELNCSDVSIGKAYAGAVTLDAHLDDEDDLLKFSLANSPVAGQNAFKVDGNYNSLSKYLNARATFNDFNPGIAQKALASYCSALDGHINGKITASGPVSELSIRSNDFRLTDVNLTLVPTGVSYTLNADARYDEEGVIIDRLDIKDTHDGHALLSGRLGDMSLHLNRLRVLDKASGDYNGTLALNGDIFLSAKDLSHMSIDANLSNAGSGKINLVLSGKNNKSSEILQFKEKEEEEDELEQRFTLTSPSGTSQIDAKCRFSVNPGLELNAILDREGSNSLNVSGDGVITADLNSKSGALNLGGNYNITEGKYHFSAIGSLIAKDFNIQDGSSLTFAGDVMDTELNISAVHSLKTSLGVLISDTTSVATRRLVNCGIKISDKVRNPQLAFSIDVPDLDPTTKALVDSELNTEDKVSRQFLALVVLGSFISGDQNGVVNNNSGSNFIYGNLASLMSGQLNTIMQKFNIPVDLGLSYQQTDWGNNIMDVAVSTQLFDNMVSVNGSVGNRNYSSTSSGENMVGDLDINIKLNKSGHFRLNLFSHSADDYTNYLDNSQRNGVGLSYQIEFNSIRSFFKSLFKKEDDAMGLVPSKKIVIENE